MPAVETWWKRGKKQEAASRQHEAGSRKQAKGSRRMTLHMTGLPGVEMMSIGGGLNKNGVEMMSITSETGVEMTSTILAIWMGAVWSRGGVVARR